MEDEDNEEFEDSDDEGEAAMVARTMNYMKRALYYVTDSARFQPPRKRPKYVFLFFQNMITYEHIRVMKNL